jgi:NitT/TauT family transport system substrate-binding protein
MHKLTAVIVIACTLVVGPAHGQAVEQRNVSVAIGTWVIQYLPLPVAAAKGFFKDEGLDVQIINFQAGGSKALQALIGGSADTVVGYYDHTIAMQAQHKDIRCVILLNQLPGEVIAVRKDPALQIHSLADLKGKRVGVTALGSSTEFQLRYQAAKAGVDAKDLTIIPVGSGPTAIAAVEHKAVDALVTQDPTATVLERRGLVDVLVDARTMDGTVKTFGGRYPTACLYITEAWINRNPVTVQHLVNALARALRWIADSSPAEIVAALPKEYILGDPATFTEVIEHSKPIFPTVGNFDLPDLQRAGELLAGVDDRVHGTTIDFARTYTNKFVDAVPPPK